MGICLSECFNGFMCYKYAQLPAEWYVGKGMQIDCVYIEFLSHFLQGNSFEIYIQFLVSAAWPLEIMIIII